MHLEQVDERWEPIDLGGGKAEAVLPVDGQGLSA
jgi:hypothetical protein